MNRGPNQKVTVIDLTTGSVIGVIPIGAELFVLAVNPDTGHLFVVCGDHVNDIALDIGLSSPPSPAARR